MAFLRREHANERGAALAYRGHAASVSDPEERAGIARIEAEEWHHREQLAGYLAELGSAPGWLERPLAAVGYTLGLLCHVTGWLMPMLGAGWIERRNALGYLRAAEDAAAIGRPDLAQSLVALGEVEIAHHAWFTARVRAHPVGARLPLRPVITTAIGG